MPNIHVSGDLDNQRGIAMTEALYSGIQELSFEEISSVDGAGFFDFLSDVGQAILDVLYWVQELFG